MKASADDVRRLARDLAHVGISEQKARFLHSLTDDLEYALRAVPEWDPGAPVEDRCDNDRWRDAAARACARYLLRAIGVDDMGGCPLCQG